MKKILCLFMPVLLCGCSGVSPFKAEKPDYDGSYTVLAQIDCKSLSCSAEIKRSGTGDYVFCFSEPESLSGLTVAINDEEITSELSGLEITIEESGEYCAVPIFIADSIDSLTSLSDDNITEQDEIISLETEVCGSRVFISSDKSGALLSLNCPSKGISVSFAQATDDNLAG